MAVPLTLAARCAAPAAVRLQRSRLAAASLAPRVAAAARDVAGTPLRLAARPRRAGARGLASVGGSRLLVTAASSDAPPSAESLNAAHGIPGSVAFAVHPGGGLKAVLTHANGSSAEVHLQGATVTSYCQPSGDEVLYLRPDAVFDGSKPIAGGVPICFPIFGPGAMQQHGFARNSLWAVHRSCADVNPDYPEPCVTLRLADSAATRSMWAHSFEALLEVTLKRDSLLLAFRVRNANAGGESFDFTAALHSYFEVVDAALPAVRVTGLKGKAYLDKVPDPKAPTRRTEDADAVTFGKALVDRVYLDTDAETLLEVGTGAAVSVEHQRGWRDTVVWNPYTTLPAAWPHFVCVESAVTRPVTLPAGYVWESEVKIYVIDL